MVRTLSDHLLVGCDHISAYLNNCTIQVNPIDRGRFGTYDVVNITMRLASRLWYDEGTMSKPEPTLGELVRKLREEAGLSTRKLAELSGVNQSNISRLELGRAPRSTMSSLTRIAEALDVDPRRLYAAAGLTDVDTALPSIRPYLRAKYGHLPSAKVDELVAFFNTIELEQAEKRKRKR